MMKKYNKVFAQTHQEERLFDALLNVHGHIIPTDRPHTAPPSSPTTGLGKIFFREKL